jgi:hypothetical protein
MSSTLKVKFVISWIRHGDSFECMENLFSQNYCVSELCPWSGIINTRKHNVSETGYVSFLKRRGGTY